MRPRDKGDGGPRQAPDTNPIAGHYTDTREGSGHGPTGCVMCDLVSDTLDRQFEARRTWSGACRCFVLDDAGTHLGGGPR